MDTNDTGEKKMIKILIVEDEEPISNLIRINLRKAGYLCDCAFDGLEAADRMAEGGYDLSLRLMGTNCWNMPRHWTFL